MKLKNHSMLMIDAHQEDAYRQMKNYLPLVVGVGFVKCGVSLTVQLGQNLEGTQIG